MYQELRKAMAGQDLEELDAALERVVKSRVSSRLDKNLLMKADNLRSRLVRARLLRILKLKQSTVSEILSYSRPQPIVHSIMAVTYLLLGENERNLKVSRNIRG